MGGAIGNRLSRVCGRATSSRSRVRASSAPSSPASCASAVCRRRTTCRHFTNAHALFAELRGVLTPTRSLLERRKRRSGAAMRSSRSSGEIAVKCSAFATGLRRHVPRRTAPLAGHECAASPPCNGATSREPRTRSRPRDGMEQRAIRFYLGTGALVGCRLCGSTQLWVRWRRRSDRRFIAFVHAATKSRTSFSRTYELRMHPQVSDSMSTLPAERLLHLARSALPRDPAGSPQVGGRRSDVANGDAWGRRFCVRILLRRRGRSTRIWHRVRHYGQPSR